MVTNRVEAGRWSTACCDNGQPRIKRRNKVNTHRSKDVVATDTIKHNVKGPAGCYELALCAGSPPRPARAGSDDVVHRSLVPVNHDVSPQCLGKLRIAAGAVRGNMRAQMVRQLHGVAPHTPRGPDDQDAVPGDEVGVRYQRLPRRKAHRGRRRSGVM